MVLLSLDSVSPYFPLVHFQGVPSKGEFQVCIRDCILKHRESDENVKTGLLALALDSVALALGQTVGQNFEYWLKHVYVFSSLDYSCCSAWTAAALDLFKMRTVLDENFGLPARMGRVAQEKALRDLSLADFHKVEEEQENAALSEWDTEMYARHSLFDEMRDPLVPLKLTFKQVRFRRFVGWLVEQTDAGELAAFQENIREAVRKHNADDSAVDKLQDIATLALPHADNISK